MKIRSVTHNNRRKAFEVKTSTKKLPFPFAKAEPTPTIHDPVAQLFVDHEAANEAFSYSVLPRTAKAGSLRRDDEALDCLHDFGIELGAIVEDQVHRR